jgi:hypothetical protein
MLTLDELALKHGTDKSSASHNYTAIYEPLFEPLRHQPITLLELGYYKGASAATWCAYFTHPAAHIISVDLEQPPGDPFGDCYQADQASHPALNKIHQLHGPFDIVIDDASHISSKTIASFEILWPMLKPGGYYIVEDTHGSYHEQFYGTSEADKNPNTRRHTTMHYFKRLVDDVNYHNEPANPDWALYPRKYWRGYTLTSITFLYNLIILRKAA